MFTLSTGRGRLASFEHAYAVVVQLRLATGRNQFVVQTGDPMQPFRVAGIRPRASETVLARVA